MPRLEAPSISSTSREEPWVISRQLSQVLSGCGVGPSTQLRALARMRATEVLPTPRGPLNRKAWATRPCARAFCRVRVMGS